MRSLFSLAVIAALVACIRAQGTPLDQQFERLDDARENLQQLTEMVEALAAQMQQQTTFLNELETVELPRLDGTNTRQDVTLDNRDDRIAQTQNRINSELMPALTGLEAQRTANQMQALDNSNALTRQLGDNLDRRRMAAELLNAVRSQKDKLERATENMFRQLEDDVEAEHAKIASTRAQENRFRCEVGRVNLRKADRQVGYTFQTPFLTVPQVLHGICGYNFDVNPDSTHHGQPQAMGVRSAIYPTKKGLQVRVQDASFGDAGLIDLTVCFQACTFPR